MSTNLIPFAYQDCLVRSVMRSGEPWFVAVDVCKALGIKNARDAISKLDTDEKVQVTNPSAIPTPPVAINDGGSGNSAPLPNGATLNLVSEPGVYRLVFTSRKAEAERFKRWLAHEVLPALRRTGTYAMPGAPVELQRTRSETLERLIRFDADYVPEQLASLVAHLPIWDNGRRPKFWSDIEVRELLTVFHRQVTVDQSRAFCIHKFGLERTPSRTAIARYWQKLDLVRGIGPVPAPRLRIQPKTTH